MIGYHYTSWENWRRIQVEGLQPYLIHKRWMLPDYPSGVQGIWTWLDPQYGDAHRGQALWVMLRHHTNRVVVLSYQFKPHHVLRPRGGGEYRITHTGDMDTRSVDDLNHRAPIPYHQNERCAILTRSVPVKRIRLENVVTLCV